MVFFVLWALMTWPLNPSLPEQRASASVLPTSSAVRLLASHWKGGCGDWSLPPAAVVSWDRDVPPHAGWIARFEPVLNPGPFVSRFWGFPDGAPAEPRDAPFAFAKPTWSSGRGTSPVDWQPRNDLDLAAGVWFDRRHYLLIGYSPTARGRFTPRQSPAAAAPSIIFLQIRRSW